MRGLTHSAVLALILLQGTTYRSGQILTRGDVLPGICTVPDLFLLTVSPPSLFVCAAPNVWTDLSPVTRTPSGLVTLVVTGTCPAGWTEVSALNGRMLRGTVAANGDVGTTGGADSLTPAGTIAWPAGVPTAATEAAHTHAGSLISWPGSVPTAATESVHTHSVTAVGTNGTVTITPLLNPVAWPVGVPTFAGSLLATHAHELPWQIPTTTTIRQIAVAAFGTGTSRAATAVSAAGTANTTSAAVALSEAKSAGTPAGIIAWPAGVPTVTGASTAVGAEVFTGSSVTSGAGTAHTHTLSWPAGVPTNGGTGAGTAHTHTLSWPAGVPTLTGSAFDNRSAYTNVIFCSKT